MSLLNLKSVFQKELDSSIKEFSSNRVTDVNGTNFFNEPPQPPNNIATNPTDFSTANGNNDSPFIPLNQLGESFLDGLSWESLYNSNHSPKDNPSHNELTPISYGVNVNRDKLNIRNPEDGIFGFAGSFRTSAISGVGKLIGELPLIGYIPIVSNIQSGVSSFLQDTGKEPYIVSNIPTTFDPGGRLTNSNFLDRGLPIERIITDVFRVGKFLTSPAGLSFITKQTALGLQGQKYKSSYNPLSTLIATGGRAGGGPGILIDRTSPNLFNIFTQTEYPDFDPGAMPIQDLSSGNFIRTAAQIGINQLTGTRISTQDFGQGSPMAVQYLIDKEFGFNPANFLNLLDADKPRFGPLRSPTVVLDAILPDLDNKINNAKDAAGEKLAEIGDKITETAKKYATGIRSRFRAKETPSFKLEGDGTLTPNLPGMTPMGGLEGLSYQEAHMRHYRGAEGGLMTTEQKQKLMDSNGSRANTTTDLYSLYGISPPSSTAAGLPIGVVAPSAIQSAAASATSTLAGEAAAVGIGPSAAGTLAGVKASARAGINIAKDTVGSLAGSAIGNLKDSFKRTTDTEYPNFDTNVDGESPLQKESDIRNQVPNYTDSTTGLRNLHNSFVDGLGKGDIDSVIMYPDNNTGDLFTNLPFSDNINNLNLEDAHSDDIVQKIESSESGMPFYFKDMRTNAYIFFRAYVEGLTENISPSYAVHNYIGRSEPVYTYERGEREISMTLKLFAQTKGELTSIYEKMNRLTSLCYPEYVDEGETGYGNRMKPPFTKLRYGELFGKMSKELMGYIKSVSYSYEQSSPYEIEVGKRVPKHIVATIGYQVIHDRTPSISTKFYGISETIESRDEGTTVNTDGGSYA